MKIRLLRILLVLMLVLGVAVLLGAPQERSAVAKKQAIDEELERLHCHHESRAETVPPWLDAIWEKAKVAAKRDKWSRGRPEVCWAPYPVIVCDEDGCMRFAGYHLRERNAVLVMLTPHEATDDMMTCIVMHEFGHALLGPGHDAYGNVRGNKAFPGCRP